MESDRPDSLLLDILRRLRNVKEAAKTILFNLILKLKLRQPEMDIDRLSALPDSLLIDILRRLPNEKEAAKTAVLSKQWRFFWTNMSDLTVKFNNTSRDPDEIERVIAGVQAAAASAQKLSVSFRYFKRFASDIDAVLNTTAESNRVEYLNLSLDPIRTPQATSWDRYTLPQAIYSHPQLKTLILRNCNLAPPVAAEWRCMTDLTIYHAELTQQTIDGIMSSCPVLRRLHLFKCHGFNRLEIRGKSFRRLRLAGCCDCDGDQRLLEISAPYMSELAVDFAARRTKLRLTDSSSLEIARIRISGCGWGSISDKEMLWTGELFDKITRVRALAIDHHCLKRLSMMREKGWRFPESRIKELEINGAYNEEVYAALAMIQFWPFIEKLHVENRMYIEESMKWDPNVLADLDHDLSHLKNVQIEFCVHTKYSGELLFTLAQIILKRAPILEKMAIRVRTLSHSPGSDELIKKFQIRLTNYPRSSQIAVVDIMSGS